MRVEARIREFLTVNGGLLPKVLDEHDVAARIAD